MILFIAMLIIAAMLSTRISARYGLPLLLLFILLGFLAGSDVLNLIYFDNALLTKQIADILLMFIIFDGGFRISRKSFQTVAGPAIALATLGVAITALALGICIHFILKLDVLYAMMIASIISSTDAAAVQMITKQYPIKDRLATTLTIESAANDPMAILLTVAFLQLIVNKTSPSASVLLDLLWQFAGGALAGLVVSKLSVLLLEALKSDNRGNYHVITLGFILLAYGLAEVLKANGIIAVFFMGYWLGNSTFPAKKSISNFMQSVSTMCNLALFLLLGLLAFPSRFLHIWKQGLIIIAVMILIARPLAVFISTLPFKYSGKEKLLLMWGGIKGAVPIVLATYPAAYAIDKDGIVFDVIFFAVFLSCLIQGTTLGPLARRLRFTEPKRTSSPYEIELHATSHTDIEMFELRIAEDAPCRNRRIAELGLSHDILITAIVRNEKIILPKGNATLKANDIVYVLAPAAQIDAVNEQLNSCPSSQEESRSKRGLDGACS